MRGPAVRIAASLILALVSLELPSVLLPTQHDARMPIVSAFLQADGLDKRITATALELRLGLQTNYDTLATTQAQLDRVTSELAVRLETVDLGSERPDLESFASFRRSCEERRDVLESYPTANAAVQNSLHILPLALERAQAAAATHEQRDELAELTQEALSYSALGKPSSYAPLKEALGRLRQENLEPGAVPNLLEHLRHVTEGTRTVREQLVRLESISNEPHLRRAFGEFERTFANHGMRRSRTEAFLQAFCLAVAFSACLWIYFTAVRQNRDLEREMAERERANEDKRTYEQQLQHAQKLEAVGQLAAGIAHEINTPTQYVSDNLTFLRESFEQVLPLLAECERLAQGDESQAELAALRSLCEEIEMDFLREEIPEAFTESIGGLGRVADIVRAMKAFSHPGSLKKEHIDLNEAIRNTVTVARNEWRYIADLDLELARDLPTVPCFHGELNQVVLNLIVNAAHAIGDTLDDRGGHKGNITIRTRQEAETAVIEIQDDGPGIPEEIRHRIFDPFFTTKDVGKGTGQGLAIAHAVVVEKHGGALELKSELRRGTTFVIRLPLASEPLLREARA